MRRRPFSSDELQFIIDYEWFETNKKTPRIVLLGKYEQYGSLLPKEWVVKAGENCDYILSDKPLSHGMLNSADHKMGLVWIEGHTQGNCIFDGSFDDWGHFIEYAWHGSTWHEVQGVVGRRGGWPGKCIRRGGCCRNVMVPEVVPARVENAMTVAEQPRAWRTYMNNYDSAKRSEYDGEKVEYRRQPCVLLQKDTKNTTKCVDYENRPKMCKKWPEENPDMSVEPYCGLFNVQYIRSPFGDKDTDYWNEMYYGNISDKRNDADEGATAEEYARYVTSLLDITEFAEPRTVADFGCGDGKLLAALKPLHPKAEMVGFEPSFFARKTAVHSDVRNFSLLEGKSPTVYDLVICKSVLQYVKTENVDMFVRRLRDATKGPAVIAQTMTTEMYKHLEFDDPYAKSRPAAFYREIIDKYFIAYGHHLYVRRDRFDAKLYTDWFA